MKPNAQQQACIDAINGTYVTIAGPGTGKTTTLVNRYLAMLMKGIPSKDILNLTFTNAAAESMVKKVGLLDADSVFRTFHSFCIELLKKERQHLPFKLIDTVIPVQLENYDLLFMLAKRYPMLKNFREIEARISDWKRRNIDPEKALDMSHGIDYMYALAYEEYEIECRKQGWLDFDSVIRETRQLLATNQEVRDRWKRKYIAVDECQDTDIVQFEILKLLFDGNIFVVGDENQCQPPGTLVDVLVNERRGRKKAHIQSVPIEELSETNDKLVSWDYRGKRLRLGSGRRFRRAVRFYDGNLLTLISKGKKTKVTPSHLVWVKFNRRALKKKTHFVYLMWRKGFGFRVGTSTLRSSCGSNQISHRGYQEQANKMWILDVVSSGKEARLKEEIYSLQYQIPERCYQDSESLQVFKSVKDTGGFNLLREKGLLFGSPLISWSKREKHLTKFHGYFKTAAANVLQGLMDLPTKINYASSPVERIVREEYHGPVYSLEVEKDHTYVADGIPVGNCIYEWRSAQADNLTKFNLMFPNVRRLYLGENYRSTKSLVRFFKKILPVDNGLADHMFTENEEGTDPVIKKYADPAEEAYWVLAQITDPINTAIIARTNRQLFEFQRICTMRDIKYQILGKKDFWEQNEVKKLLALAKEEASAAPASDVLTRLIDRHNLIERYQNAATKDSNPIENLNNVVKMAVGKGNIVEFMTYLRKRTHGRKSSKGLTLSTVHQAKGREWDNVFIVGAQQGKMPHEDGSLAEEHRIFFVACTRAAKFLHVSYVGGLSMFLNEFEDQVIDLTKEDLHEETES